MSTPVKVGDVIGIFRIVSDEVERNKYGQRVYLSECIYCGREFVRTLYDTKKAKECLHVGMYGYKEYHRTEHPKLKQTYHSMVERCENNKVKSYQHYGGKGIKVCEEWHRYSSFEEWALSHGYEDGLTIDRIDSTKDYCPENCRWIPRAENARFKSTTNVIEVNGIVMSGRQWSDALGLGVNTINRKVRNQGIEQTKAFIKERMEMPR